MRLKNILTFAILGYAMGTCHGHAQTEPAKPGEPRFGNATSTGRAFQDYVYGVIKQINKEELIVDKTPFGDAQNFRIDHKTKFIRDGKSSRFEDLKVGDKVWIDMKSDKKSGQMTAKKVVTGTGPAGLQ